MMKILFFLLFLVCPTLGSPFCALADSPPSPITLAVRVELATNIIVGTAKKVTVLEWKDGKFEEVNPEPKSISPSSQVIDIEVEVNEVIYPLGWKPNKTVRYLFGSNQYEVENIRDSIVGKEFIYLMTTGESRGLKNLSEFFFPSYEPFLEDSLDKKVEIQAILQARTKRELPAK